ncbi:hypothetical protein, partial [Klebsiella pneumoniae]|uniref:hypothetical protein n=1 Tax=Klebsiella pneumoniae TaxID=573 RepID=UPI003EE10DEC
DDLSFALNVLNQIFGPREGNIPTLTLTQSTVIQLYTDSIVNQIRNWNALLKYFGFPILPPNYIREAQVNESENLTVIPRRDIK